MLGTELTIFTLVFREKEQGPAAVAALFIAGALPSIVFSPWAGTIADRFSTRSVIPLFSLIGGIAIFSQTQQLPTWLILILLFISSACGTVVAPTWGKLVRTLAAPEDFSRANGVIQSYFALAMLSGPFVAGYLVTTTGFVWTFLIDGFFTTLIAVMPFLLNVNFKPEKLQPGEKVKVTGGYAQLFNDKFLRALTIMVFAMVLCISVVNVGDIFLLTEQLHANAFIYGLVGAGFALGSLLGGLLAGKLKLSAMTELTVLGAGLGVLSLSGLAVGLAPNYWFVLVIWFFAGMGNAAINSYGVGMMIRAIPMEVQGRTFAAFNGIISTAGIGSQAAAGVILGFVDVRTLFVIAGVLAFTAFATLFPVVFRTQREIIAAA
ncbi:MAG: hypothetical protein RL719_411 [Actinomycetota bacterium]